MEGCQEFDLELEADGLIDDNQFSGTICAEKEVDNDLSIDENDHFPELHESMEPGRTKKNGRYNLRKSLAWDSAFFTNAGVLDAEELSSMITRADKGEKNFLPGIQEDITGSTESISTLESDHLTLENLDDDLFLDIRASIQRSSKKPSNLTNSSTKTAAKEVDNAAISSLRKEELGSQNKIMQSPKPGLKKNSGLPAVRMSKCQPKQNIGKLGSAKAIKQDSGHSQINSTAKSGETNTKPPKLPKTLSSSIPISTAAAAAAKRESVGTSRLKSESGSSKFANISNKGTQPPKVSVLSGARRALPKPAVLSKSSLSGSSNTSRMQSTGSSTSSDSSSNTSSATSSKSTLMAARRNPGKSGNVGTSSIPKTAPSRAGLKNKTSSSLSTKISTSVSPASSISEWSSASSSSSSTANQRCNNSRTSLDVSSRKSVDLDRNKSQGVISTNNNSKKSGTLQAPAKPSGLRMPSPKIGFFDGVKSAARTPNGTPTCSPIRSSNSKVKGAKAPTSKIATSSTSIKHDSPKASLPASSLEKSHALVNASDVPGDVKDSPKALFEEKSHALVDASDVPRDAKDSPKLLFEETSLALTDASDVQKDVKDSPASFEEKSHALVHAYDVPREGNDSPASFEEKPHSFIAASDVARDAKDSPATFEEKSDALVNDSDVPKDAKDSPASFEEKTHALVDASNVQRDAKDSPASFEERPPALVNASDVPKDAKDSPTSFEEKSHALLDASDVPIDVTDSPALFEESPHSLVEASDIPKDVKDSQASFEERPDALLDSSDIPKDVEDSLASLEENTYALVNASDLPIDAKDSQVSCEEKPHALASASVFSTDVKDSPGSSLGVEGNATGESCRKGEKVQAEDVLMKDKLGDLDLHEISGDVKIDTVEMINASGSGNVDQIGDVLVNQNHHPEKNSDPICKATDNEHSDVNYEGEVLQNDNKDLYENVDGLSDGLLNGNSERAACRTPLAPMNTLCSNNESVVDMSKESAFQVVVAADKTGFVLPSAQKENS